MDYKISDSEITRINHLQQDVIDELMAAHDGSGNVSKERMFELASKMRKANRVLLSKLWPVGYLRGEE